MIWSFYIEMMSDTSELPLAHSKTTTMMYMTKYILESSMNSMEETKNTAQKNEIQRIKLKIKDLMFKQLDCKDFTPINPAEIRNYVYYGFSDNELRPSYWKILLNYYPSNKFKMEQFYRQARQSYNEILSEYDKKESVLHTIKIELERTLFSDTEKASIERILTAFSVTNPGIGYVQGMINLCHIFYYVLSTSKDVETSKFAEEDSFYLFNNLISEMSNLFVGEFDDQKQGIKSKIDEVFGIIKDRDPELYDMMEKKDLIKTMFPLRWILLLFSAEYSIEKTIWLWDKILSDSYRFELLSYCAAAVAILMRNSIFSEEYEGCMEILQNPSIISPELLFDIADIMRRNERDINDVIKERISGRRCKN